MDEINLDTNTAIAFVSEGSTIRYLLKVTVSGKQMVMTTTADQEFQRIVMQNAGPREQARSAQLSKRIKIVQDNLSARARSLRPTKNLGALDIEILGTGDALGIETMTSDRRAVSAARAQALTSE